MKSAHEWWTRPTRFPCIGQFTYYKENNMTAFTVTWESWERGSVEIEAATEGEARRIFDEEHVGLLNPAAEGLDIVGVEKIDPTS